ncbi:uncharacterized protein YbaP (TraB family) [Dysgonomonadaceae bacterium PH5-43]|nr:uncharacterized protein YbaP (TraB family) [Dysgonomonadaceae bacterium PH5-43]
MKTKTLLSIIAIILFSCNLSAQKYPTGSLLWKVSGNGLEQDSYVFATWHGSPEICTNFLDSINNFYKIFDSCTQFVGETSDNNSEIAKAMMKPLGTIPLSPDTTYNDLLSEEDIALVDSVGRKYFGESVPVLKLNPNMLTFVIASANMANQYVDKSGEKCETVMDTYLMSRARENNYSMVGLDNEDILQEQTKLLLFEGKIPNNLQDAANYLVKTIKELDEHIQDSINKNQTDALAKAYREKDLNKILEIKENSFAEMKEKYDEAFVEQLNEFLIIERNNIWMQEIPELIKYESTFIAVGAAHLAGEKGLLNQLKLKGYTVEAVK